MFQSHDPTYPLYPIFSFIGFFISTIPLGWHLHAWNAGTRAYLIWTALVCLSGFVNSLVWSGNVLNHSPVWCDISSKFIIGFNVGIPASIACISRRLYCIISIQSVSRERQNKRRMITMDLCIAVGLPALVMVLHCIVQSHRFDIIEDVGCYPVVTNALPAYFIYFMWPVVLGLVSFAYSVLSLLAFWTRRAVFSDQIHSVSPMSISLYLRFIILAIINTTCTVAAGVYTIYQGTTGSGLVPWISWQHTHSNFSRVGLFPSAEWRSHSEFEITVETSRWLPITSAFIFFVLFGFASEARERYSSFFWRAFGTSGLKGHPYMKPSEKTLPSWAKPLKLDSSASRATISPPPYMCKSTTTSIINPQLNNDSNQSLEYSSQPHLPHRLRIDPSFFKPPPSRVTPDAPSSPSSSPYSSSLDLTIVEMSCSSSRATPSAKPSITGSLHTMKYGDRFYLATAKPRSGSVSPAPFADITFAGSSGYHDPKHHLSLDGIGSSAAASSLSVLGVMPPLANGIFVTVHTVSDAGVC